MDSRVIDAGAVLPFSRGAKYMDNHPSAVPANARRKKDGSERERERERERENARATGAPNAAKLITARRPLQRPTKRDRGSDRRSLSLETSAR